jgi:hypothetical protein
MAKIITKFDAYCSDPKCGRFLPAGTPARYYGRNGLFGIHCHVPSKDEAEERAQIKGYKRAKQLEREKDFRLEEGI